MLKRLNNSRLKLRKKETSLVLVKLANMFIKHGSKTLTLNLIMDLMRQIKIKTKLNPTKVILGGIKNVAPVAELRPKVRGRATFKVPFPISKNREMGLGIKLIVSNLSKRTEPSLLLRLSGELLDCYNKKGNSYRDKLALNKEIKQNRNFVRLFKII